eukprot:TRINITY_DN31714_c4_g2_i1.p1 TRINITY_DN31714_c4_g2~~TRINITY_DN31714_c4_g2_i1.p1  ORF type:complete len:654 (+),score=113.53 TRINITY_DN31714_c4_g2_i1:51-2012(+)
MRRAIAAFFSCGAGDLLRTAHCTSHEQVQGQETCSDILESPSDDGLSLRHLHAERLRATRQSKEAISSVGEIEQESPQAPGSCKTIGCGYYRRTEPCQCNHHCVMHGNCCPDYASYCTEPHRRAIGYTPPVVQFGGCAFYGCNKLRPAMVCGCSANCVQKKDCCRDYQDICHRGKHFQDFQETVEAERYLLMIDARLGQQPRQLLQGGIGLMQTFGPGSLGGGSCDDERCKLPGPCPEYDKHGRCRFDVYDNAVAAIYFTKRGKLEEARNILKAFLRLLYPKPGQHISGPSFGPKDGLPSGRTLTPLAASYTQEQASAGSYSGENVFDGGVDAGNNAWVGLAFAHFADASGQPCFATVARDILWALARSVILCEDKLQGFMARLPPYPGKYRSTEHNIDIFALARILSDYDTQMRATVFVQNMYGYDQRYNHSYTMGTAGDSTCDADKRPAPVACDAQFWNLLADIDPQQHRKRSSLAAALIPAEHGGMLTQDSDIVGNGTSPAIELEGFRFSNWGHGIQWENTASAVMAMSLYRQRYGEEGLGVNLTQKIQSIQKSVLTLLDTYGVVPASALGGNLEAWFQNDHTSEFPGGSDTGIGWTYLRYGHVASTAWAGLMLLFTGGDVGNPVNQDANPFAPPGKKLPVARDLSCFPD